MGNKKNKSVTPEIKKRDKTYTNGPDIAIDIGEGLYLSATLQFLLILICIRITLLGRIAFRIFRA
jgi:hypothetical protein